MHQREYQRRFVRDTKVTSMMSVDPAAIALAGRTGAHHPIDPLYKHP
jgi:hypothetical protein